MPDESIFADEPPSVQPDGADETVESSPARAEDDGLPLVKDTPAVTDMTAPQLGEGAQPGADSDEGVPGVERTQQERDSDDVPAPTLPEELETDEEPPDALEPLASRDARDPEWRTRVPEKMRGGFPLYQGELPPDIEAIWGGGRLDGMKQPAHITARHLIHEWGMDVFRGSAIHQMAILESKREAKMEPIRKAFIAAQGKKTTKVNQPKGRR